MSPLDYDYDYDFDRASHSKSSIGIGIAPISNAAYGAKLYLSRGKDPRNTVYSIPDPLPQDTPFPFSRLNACSAGATALAIVYAWARDTATDDSAVAIFPSIPFIFYYARYLEGVEGTDVGVTINSAIRACVYKGFCDDTSFAATAVTEKDKPTDDQVNAAAPNAILDYKVLRRDTGDIASCIAEGGPVLMRIVVNEEKAEDVRWGRDGYYSFNPRGVGHCVLAVGFDETSQDSNEHFLWVRDAAGPSPSQQGRRPIRYTDVRDATLTSDFWTLFAVTPRPAFTPANAPQTPRQVTDIRDAYDDHALVFSGWVDQVLDPPASS